MKGIKLLFISMLSLFGMSLFAQTNKIDLSITNQPLKNFISIMESKFGYTFMLDQKVNRDQLITVNVKQASVETVLTRAFAGKNISWEIVGTKIILKEKPANVSPQEARIITGTVTDESGKPMSGVNVMVQGTRAGTTSGVDGRYRITVPNAGAKLNFIFIGYGEQTISVGNQSVINVTMIESSVALDEVEIISIGYGSVRQRDVTGSVASADMAEIQKMPVASTLEGLAGRISGVQIISADGTPGQSSSVVIRGSNSITGDNNPLYVVDGFPQGEDFDIEMLAPSEIQSIVILKDASSTAIYGSRGANGVIMITTQRGAISAKPIITYRGVYGMDEITKRIPVMSPYDFVLMEYERNPSTPYLNDRTLEDYRNERGVNWQDKFFREGYRQSHTLSIRGGTEHTKYNLSGNYYDQQGTIIASEYQRYNLKTDLDQQINKWMKGGLSLSYSRRIQTGVQPSVNETGIADNSNVFPMYNLWGYMPVSRYPNSDDFDFEDDLIDPDINTISDYRVNPYISTKNEYRKQYRSNFKADAYLDFKITDELSFRTIGQISQSWNSTEQFNNSYTRSGHPNSRWRVNGSISNSESSNWVNENILTYVKNFSKKHKLTVTGAATFEKSDGKGNGYSSYFLPNEQKGMAGLDEGEIRSKNAYVNPGIQRISFLGRLIYDYHSRYLATVSMRADGSSKFAKENRWGYFPSASLAWNFGKENFFKGQKILSNGKVRASWGLTGNDRIGSDDRFQQMDTPYNNQYPVGNEWQTVSYIGYPGNAALRWERTEQTNIGIDLGFLKGKISLTADVYRKNTRDLLLNTTLPGSTGYTTLRKNIGQVQNQGLEISLKSVNIKRQSFEWRTDFNIAFNQNKVVALADGQPSRLTAVGWDSNFSSQAAYIAQVGGEIGQMYGYIWEGVYQPSDFIYGETGVPTLKPNVPFYTANQPGDYKYADVNGDGVVDDNDRQVIGNSQPLHQGGINNMFSYKGFDLSVFFRWSYGNDILNANRLVMESGVRARTNQFATYANRWTYDNQNTGIQRTEGYGSYYYSSRVVEDASFLRLQTVAFGYTFPKKWLQKVSVSGARLSLAANNLYVWTNYSGYDPEVSVRQTAMTRGFDFSAYPRARTMTLTLNLTF